MPDYGYTKTDAARAELDGLPAILPDGNRWKPAALDHRFGKHYDGCPQGCPHYGTSAAKQFGITSSVEGLEK